MMQALESVRFPEEAGVSSRGLLNYIAAREAAGLEHHAIWVLRHGKVACKLAYAPYDDHTPHMLFSLSKSFCSAAAGFAVAEGLLHWDTRLIDVLPEKFPASPSEWLRSITLHHLLTMGSGLKPESDNVGGDDWASAVLACDCDHEPGTHFHYNSHGTYLVSCMVQKVTGMTIRDYLIPRLFAPLGMMKPDGSAPDWDCCPAGINIGGWGLWLSCAQLAPFGQCLLQKGVWDGQQVLPREWLDRATVQQIDNGNGDHTNENDWNQGYGYQFWMCRGDETPGFTPRYRGDGMYSQFVIVDEKRDMVVCCVSGVGDIGKALDLIYTHLIAAADMEPADEAAQTELQRQLATLAYPWPTHDGSALPEGVYAFENVTLTVRQEQVIVDLGNEVFTFGVGRVHRENACAACCGMENGVLRLMLRLLKGPFTLDASCRFAGDTAEVTLSGVGQKGDTLRLTKQSI
ncbi:MAG: serine hydrolase domain-containing protein [Aristaeellaceae bacterium]